jgi:hypothetical protein
MASVQSGNAASAIGTLDEKLLFDEYKLLQEKIDRIGAYKFQIKGLVITLVGLWLKVVSDVVKDHKLGNTFFWANALVVVVLLAFWLLERRQSNFQSAYSERSTQIELLARDKGKNLFPAYQKGSWSIGNAIDRVTKNQNRFLKPFVNHAEGIFYWLVVVSVVLVTLLQIFVPRTVTAL